MKAGGRAEGQSGGWTGHSNKPLSGGGDSRGQKQASFPTSQLRGILSCFGRIWVSFHIGGGGADMVLKALSGTQMSDQVTKQT